MMTSEVRHSFGSKEPVSCNITWLGSFFVPLWECHENASPLFYPFLLFTTFQLIHINPAIKRLFELTDVVTTSISAGKSRQLFTGFKFKWQKIPKTYHIHICFTAFRNAVSIARLELHEAEFFVFGLDFVLPICFRFILFSSECIK